MASLLAWTKNTQPPSIYHIYIYTSLYLQNWKQRIRPQGEMMSVCHVWASRRQIKAWWPRLDLLWYYTNYRCRQTDPCLFFVISNLTELFILRHSLFTRRCSSGVLFGVILGPAAERTDAAQPAWWRQLANAEISLWSVPWNYLEVKKHKVHNYFLKPANITYWSNSWKSSLVSVLLLFIS